jgi:hypothetical protein
VRLVAWLSFVGALGRGTWVEPVQPVFASKQSRPPQTKHNQVVAQLAGAKKNMTTIGSGITNCTLDSAAWTSLALGNVKMTYTCKSYDNGTTTFPINTYGGGEGWACLVAMRLCP